MRARNIILTIAAAALLAAPTAVFAQTGPGPGEGDGPGQGWGSGFGRHGGGQGGIGGGQGGGMLRMIPRILRHLELEPGQQEQIEGILDYARATIEPIVGQSNEARDLFHQQFGIGDYSQENDDTYREFFETQAALDVEIRLISADAMSQVWNLLTDEQRQQLEDMRGSFGNNKARRSGGRRSSS